MEEFPMELKQWELKKSSNKLDSMHHPKDERTPWHHKSKGYKFWSFKQMAWRFHYEENSLWKQTIEAKYSNNTLGTFPSDTKHSIAKAPWRSILKGRDWFEEKIKWKINKGKNLSFWHSKWIDSIPLSTKFSRLYALWNNQQATIFDMWNPNLNSWIFPARRILNDWEEIQWNNIKSILLSLDITKGSSKPSWLLNSSGFFTIASVKKAISVDSTVANINERSINFNDLWKSSIQKKCKFFLWTVFHERLNSTDVIQRRYPNMALNPNWCVSCKAATEDLNHIFINCRRAKYIWERVEKATDVSIRESNVKSLGTQVFTKSAKTT